MARDALVGAGGRPLSAEILGHLLKSSQDVLYAVALDPVRMLYATPAFARRMGLPEDFLARGYEFGEYLQSVHPDDQGRVAEGMGTIVASRSDADLPKNPACYRLRTPEGGWRTIEDTYRILRDADGVPHTLIGNARDVSEQREARQAQAENEARFRSLAENSRDIFFSFRVPEGRYEFISSKVVDLLGHTAQDFYADASLFLRCVAPAWRETMDLWNAEIAQGQVRDKYEFQVLDKHGRLRWIVERLVLVPAPDGQGMLLQGVAADITEERGAREALRASEERYRGLAEGWLDQAVIRINLHTNRYEYVSPGMEQVFGFAPEEFYRGERGIVGRTVAPEWRETVQAWMAEARRGMLQPEYEYELLDAWGRRRWVHQRCTLLHAADGTPEVVQGVLFDNTEHKRTEQALRESEERFREVVEGTKSLVTQVDGAGRFTYVNPTARTVFGLAPEDCLGRMAFDFIHPDDREATICAFADWVAEGRTHATVENRQVSMTGEVRHFTWNTHLHYDESGRPTVIDGLARDITEQKRAEEALRETNARYSLLAENVVDVIWTTDAALRWTYVSPSVEKLSGHPLARFMSMAFEELFTPEGLGNMGELMARRQKAATREEQDEAYRVEVDLRHADGSLVPLEVLIRPMRGPGGEAIGYCGTSRDITERRRAEEALRLSEARYALALRGANDGIWDWDLVEDKVYYSDRWKEIIGYGPDELEHDPQEWISRIHPEDLERVMAANGRCIKGEAPIFQVEYRLRHRDGSYRWIFGRGAALADASGRVVRMAGAHTDITGRKQTEEALFKNERLSRKLLESMHEGIWAVDANRRTTFVNERLCAMLGYASAELMNMSPTDVLEWPERHVAQNQLSDLEAGYTGATDYVLIRKDGSRFPAHVVSSPVMEEQGRFEGLVCGVVDLTERARMEHELRRNQARFEALYELSRLTPATEHKLASFTLREAIRLTDSSAGVLFFVSEDGQHLVPKAWETGEFMGGSQMPNFPASGSLPWAKVLQSGQPLLLNDFAEFANLVPPGHPPMSRLLGVPALDGSRPVAVLGLTGKDESYTAEDTLQTTLLLDGMWRVVRARRDEERIRASLREKEALLHEVHHRVKNNLQVISSLMDMAGRRLSNVEARASLEDLRGKVQAMSLIHAQLHGARSDGGISLERFVRALFHQLRELYSGGLALSLVVELSNLALGVDQAVPLGLALNEALTNVFKHASSEGRAGKVSIRTGQDAKGQVCILVRDDGPGLPEGFDPGRAQSLGMKLMHGLVCHQLGGKLEVLNCAPPEHSGVEVCICFRAQVAR